MSPTHGKEEYCIFYSYNQQGDKDKIEYKRPPQYYWKDTKYGHYLQHTLPLNLRYHYCNIQGVTLTTSSAISATCESYMSTRYLLVKWKIIYSSGWVSHNYYLSYMMEMDRPSKYDCTVPTAYNNTIHTIIVLLSGCYIKVSLGWGTKLVTQCLPFLDKNVTTTPVRISRVYW